MRSKFSCFLFLSVLLHCTVSAQVKTSKKSDPKEKTFGLTAGAGYKWDLFGELGLSFTGVDQDDVWTSYTLGIETDLKKNATPKIKLSFWQCSNFVHLGYGASLVQTFSSKKSSLSVRPEFGPGNENLRAYVSYDIRLTGDRTANKSGFLLGISARLDFKHLLN